MSNDHISKEKIDNLLKEITNSNPNVQKSAIYELGEIKISSVISELVTLLNNQNTDLDIKWLIVESLGKIGSTDIVEPLLNFLEKESEDLSVRRAAIHALIQHITYDKTLLSLLRFVDDERQDIFLRQQVKYLITNNLKKAIDAQKLQEKKDWLETLFTKDLMEVEKVLVSNTRSYSNQSSNLKNHVSRAKSICLNNQDLVLIIDCEIKDEEKITLFLEVLPQVNKGITILPPGLKISFLSPSGKALKEKIAKEADNRIGLKIPLKIRQLQISQRANKPFSIKISVADDDYTENFPSS